MDKCRAISEWDLCEIADWHGARGIVPPDRELYPRIGFIVSGVAAGFLFRTDSGICFLDGYISNPNTDREAREKALDEITDRLLLAAKDHGFTKAMAYTQNAAVRRRCERYEFSPGGDYSLYIREIERDF